MHLNIKRANNSIKKLCRISKQILLQRRYTDGSKAYENILHITNREMKIKSAMSYHFTLVRRTIIKKSTNNKCWRGCGERGTLLSCQLECSIVQALQRIVIQKAKSRATEQSHSRTYIWKNHSSKRYMHPSIHRSTIYSN